MFSRFGGFRTVGDNAWGSRARLRRRKKTLFLVQFEQKRDAVADVAIEAVVVYIVTQFREPHGPNRLRYSCEVTKPVTMPRGSLVESSTAIHCK